MHQAVFRPQIYKARTRTRSGTLPACLPACHSPQDWVMCDLLSQGWVVKDTAEPIL
jgi:hypothetical protein